MASGINKVILIGNLGNDPEVKVVGAGSTVASFSVATTERWVKDGSKQEKTEWHRIIAWNKLAEICGSYLKKGSKVYIEGKLQTRSWDQDGVKRYSTEIVALTMQILSSKDGASAGSDPGAPPPEPSGSGDDDDLPF